MLIRFNMHVIYKFMRMFRIVALPGRGVHGRGRYRLDQKKIISIKRGNSTQYLILEGLNSIGQTTLLADTEILSLESPLHVV
jgi:hypothetical protein